MKRVWLIAAVVAALLVLPGLASADSTLFYSGDFNGVNGLSNEINTVVSQANVYDNFIITGSSSWTISGLFTNNLITSLSDFSTNMAEYEIRSGVSSGVAGVLIASGTVSDTTILNGQDGFGLLGAYVTVSGLNVTLAPGQYWISVAPIGNGGGRSFESTTSFLNCIDCGAHTGDDSFFNSSFFGAFFAPANGFVGSPADFSFGVIGHVNGTQTPEPASLFLLGSGLLGLAGGIRKRMKA